MPIWGRDILDSRAAAAMNAHCVVDARYLKEMGTLQDKQSHLERRQTRGRVISLDLPLQNINVKVGSGGAGGE